MIREGQGPLLVLFHGVLGGERMWRRVVPLLAPHHDTVAATALGHRGGSAPVTRPTTITQVIDDAERLLDRLGVEKAHLAGNSMGGWVALELARRGRAHTVCALSPAGFWAEGGGRDAHATRALASTIRAARLGRPFLPFLARSAAFRRWAMRLNAAYGERLTASDLLEATDDLLGCAVGRDLLKTTEAVAAMDPLPCPVTLAWSARDRVLPAHVHGVRARALLPAARYLELDDLGHVPMFDSPSRVAKAILEVTGGAGTEPPAG